MKNFIRNGYGVMFYKDGKVYDVQIVCRVTGWIIYTMALAISFTKETISTRECSKKDINRDKDLNVSRMAISTKYKD